MRRVVVALALSITAAGCAGTRAADTPPAAAPNAGAPGGAAAPGAPGEPTETAKKRLRLAQALVQIDQRADRYAALAAEPGPEAQNERRLLGPALAAHAAEFGPELLELLGDASNPQRRRIAAKALAFSTDAAAVAALTAALGARDDPRLVTNATYALGRIASPNTPTDPLVLLAKDADADVRSNALFALWRVFEARRKLGASPVDPVAQAGVVSALEIALFDPGDPLVRAHAAAALGAIGDPRSVDPLLNLLRDEHPFVRTHSANALGKIGDPKAIPGLIAAIDTSPAGTTRQVVVLALTQLAQKLGLSPPETLGDESRAWERFIAESYTQPRK